MPVRSPFLGLLAPLFVSVAVAADPPPPVVPNPFPVLPVSPTDPPPKPDPDAATVLPDEWLLIVKSDAEFVLRASPKGKVDIIRASSPQIGGKFVGGNGKFKLETFKEKNVCIVLKKSGAAGLVELIYSPAGAKDESNDITRMVQLGTAPQPPPPVDPNVPVVPSKVTSFRVVMVYESGDTTPAAQNSILYGKAVEDFLNANCTGGKSGWVRIDKDRPGSLDPDRQAVWDAVKTEFGPPKNTKTPAVAIAVTTQSGPPKITIVPFEASPAAMVAKMKSYADGKDGK